jgi:mitochondrial fusion and transport protein UGO1
MSSPASLRDTYNAPQSSWAFIPPQPGASTSASAGPLDVPSQGSSSSYNWSLAPPPPNSIFDLSPSLNLSEPSNVDVSLLFKAFLASAFLQYTSTALVMPWEVSKMLLQVQWVPRDVPEEDDLELVEEIIEEVRRQHFDLVWSSAM